MTSAFQKTRIVRGKSFQQLRAVPRNDIRAYKETLPLFYEGACHNVVVFCTLSFFG